MSNVKRYHIGCPYCGSPNPAEIHSGKCRVIVEELEDSVEITEHPEGDWVLYKDMEKLTQLVKDGKAVVEDFLPNVGTCVLQDYGRLNQFMIDAEAID